MSAQIAFKNFESSSAGDSAASVGFINVSPATWQVTTQGPVGGTKAFGATVKTDQYAVLWNGTNPADQCIQYSYITQYLLGTYDWAPIPVLRSNSGRTTYYQIGFNCQGNAQIYKVIANSAVALGSTFTFSALTTGTAYTVKAEVQGQNPTVIRFKIWLASNSEPGTWTGTYSETSTSIASGSAGVYQGMTGTIPNLASVDNVYVGDAGITFPGPSTGTVTGASTANTGTSTTYTLTTDAAWTGTPTLTLSGSATGTITQFSAFAGATTGTASILWTGAGTATVNATFSDSLAAGSNVTTTVSSAPAVSPSTATISQGGTTTLTASGFTGGTVTWSSSNTGRATVNSSGVVTGQAHGQATAQTATITATGVSNPAQTATAAITVSAVAATVSPSSATVGVSGTQTFTASVTGTTNTAGTWSIQSGIGAINSSTGVYTAPGTTGSATVLFTSSADATNGTATAAVTVAVFFVTTSLAMFGAGYTGLSGTVGVTVKSLASNTLTTVQSRTTTGINESASGTGDYVYQYFGSVGTQYVFVWDTGGASPAYYTETLTAGFSVAAINGQTPPTNWGSMVITSGGAVSIDLTQAITDVQTATVGGALAGAWATSWGKVVKDVVNKLLGIWGPGNTTGSPSKLFTLDDGTNPTERY